MTQNKPMKAQHLKQQKKTEHTDINTTSKPHSTSKIINQTPNRNDVHQQHKRQAKTDMNKYNKDKKKTYLKHKANRHGKLTNDMVTTHPNNPQRKLK